MRRHDPEAIKTLIAEHGRELAVEQALQFAFSLQWNALREAAAKHRIRLLGDIAIFVSMDSADVWTHPEYLELDEGEVPVHVAGSSAGLFFFCDGAAVGNPLYRWGCHWRSWGMAGGWIVCGGHASCMTLCGWIIFAGSRGTGRFRQRKRRRCMESG